ncbi:MAG: ribonuclease HIII [Victivallales bacterium]|nr:ribonuclease HIII [Victivallales bacterium]
MPSSTTSHVCDLNEAQADSLRSLLAERGWEFSTPPPYARWRAKKAKVNVVAYESGKTTVQGKGTDEFVRFTLEPEILKQFRYGYESQLAELETPDMFLPHAGIDESGKGDYFGPLVVACCYTDGNSAKILLEAGVADSKTIKNDAKMLQLDEVIRKTCPGQFALVTVGPEAYNRLYDSFGNLNRLLAWGHAKALEKLLELVPDCPRAIDDQFAASKSTVENALQERGRRIILEQHPKAEADVAVAAASILARAEFVRHLKRLGDSISVLLPRGGGPAVKQTARQLASSGGEALLRRLAKIHFSITAGLGMTP